MSSEHRMPHTTTANRIFELEQCLYSLPEDFDNQANLDDVASEPSSSTISSPSDAGPRYQKLEDVLLLPLTEEMLRNICFTETLLVCDQSNDDAIVGGVAINVSLLDGQVLASFSNSRLVYGMRNAETEVISLADPGLHPLQERKLETLSCGTSKQEKMLQLYFDQSQQVTAFRRDTLNGRSRSFQGTIQPEADTTILPDGLQFPLLRYLALSNYVGEVYSQTVDIYGRVGHCVHTVSPAATSRVNGEMIEIKEIQRTILYADDQKPEESVSLYSMATGQLMRHTWTNSNLSLVFNPLLAPPATLTGDFHLLNSSIVACIENLSKFIATRDSFSGIVADLRKSSHDIDLRRHVVEPILKDLIKLAEV